MKIEAVIGANFGDEGKGRTVDWLVKQANANSLVVRHNSGGQAGHTVTLADGTRHVFSHFGSGTLRGAPTMLAHNFVVNPMGFQKEWEELEALGITPKVYLDPQCRMSSPLDVFLNQMTEIHRGADKHGSCGAGFGETIARHLRGSPLLVGGSAIATLRSARQAVSERLSSDFILQVLERGLEPTVMGITYERLWHNVQNLEFNWDKYWDYVDFMLDHVELSEPNMMQTFDHVVFEGAQGLMLHEDHPYSPHVTWCRTGAEDVVELLDELMIPDPLEIFYVSRCYITRHGAGPLLNELDERPWETIVDKTNEPNPWQGSLRFAPFQLEYTENAMMVDFSAACMLRKHERKMSNKSVLTCADQAPSLTDEMMGFADFIGWGPSAEETEIRPYLG